jgi:hypothetical protein
MEMEFIIKFMIGFNCLLSDKRKIHVIVEGKVGNVKRRVSDFLKDYGSQG